MLAQAHPDKPWLWKDDWANGRIFSSTKALIELVVVSIVWNVLCVPLWIFVPIGAMEPNGTSLWLVMVFPVAGLGLAFCAVIALVRWRKYGRSVFEMASVPGLIGGQLVGVIQIPAKIAPQHAFRLRLNCINRMITGGPRGGAEMNLLWQDEIVIAYDLLQGDQSRSAVPVSFQIPYDCPPSDERDPKNVVLWILEITVKTPGLDYAAEFNVPVFKTSESTPDSKIDRDLIGKYVARDNPEHDLRNAGVIRTSSPTGDGLRFIFRMARYPGSAIGLTLGAVAFYTPPCIWLPMDHGALATALAIPFGLSGTMLLVLALDLWFYRSVLDVSHHRLTVTAGIFGCGSRQLVQVRHVVKIEAVTRCKSDRLMYYEIMIVCHDGKKIMAGKRLPGHRLTASVIRQIEQAMGDEYNYEHDSSGARSTQEGID